MKSTNLLFAASLLLAGAAQADVAVTLDLGSTGAGAHLVVPMEKTLNGRFGVNYYRHTFSDTANAIDYDVTARLRTIDALFDWYVIDNSAFHVTAGVVHNGNRASAVAKPGASGYTINGKAYTAADVGTLTGTLDYQKAAPYLGIGWGNPLANLRKWGFTADLGAFYQGKANSTLVSIGCTTSKALCTQLVSDVAAENAKFNETVRSFRVYPVARVAATFAF
ncbi:MAG: hypothetical protein V4463_22070 [Pseudomonadota bacterium]